MYSTTLNDVFGRESDELDRTVKSIRIISTNEKDLFSLTILAEEFMPKEADNEKQVSVLERALRNPDHELLVVELEAEIVAFIDRLIIPNFMHGAKVNYIQNLFVCSKHRKKGVATKLVQEAMRNAKNRVSEIHVAAEFDNEVTIKLYRKCGFVKEFLQLEKRIQIVWTLTPLCRIV